MKILKFGGSSLAGAEQIRRVCRLIGQAAEESPAASVPAVVVVSAMGGVTNDLLAAAAAAARRDKAYRRIFQELTARHCEAAQELIVPDSRPLIEVLGKLLNDLDNLLHGSFLLRECSPRTLDGILSYGERLAAVLVAAALRADGVEARDFDARQAIVTDDSFGRAQVDLERTTQQIRKKVGKLRHIPIVTGFIGATREGRTTTLGRGGSDYTAALFGAALDAEAIELWTDVDGVMSADPRLVREAFPLPSLSYSELMELSHFGAKVVYPPTIHPARSRGIPLLIKNTFNPSAPGTTVRAEVPGSDFAIRGISSITRVALMRLEGDGMVGVPGIAMRLFGALARQGVSVILISQGSSEHSICFAVAPEDAERARSAVDGEFALERRAGIVDSLVVENDQSVIAAVGEEMRRRHGIGGKLFTVLGAHGVNVRAVAQGSSERNISLVIDRADEGRALNAIHGGFFHPGRRRVALALAGPGGVGAELLEQVRGAAESLAAENLEIRVVAVADSRRLLLDRDGVDLEGWRDALGKAPAADRRRLLELLGEPAGDLKVFVDCTASPEVPGWYPEMLERGIAVVAANKLGFAGPMSSFEALQTAARRHRAPLLFEATVGAGLPVLRTLDGLRRTGHRIAAVDGVLSGTVNAVLDRLAPDRPFSAAVRWAFDHGLTEFHPYEDLSGGDVVRKLAILARLCGRTLETTEIEVEPILPPEPWSTMDLDTFWRVLPEVDEDVERRWRHAADAGARLRYVASLNDGGARVALAAVGPEHPAGSVTGADNLVAFTTQHYRDAPLVLRGPGAGRAVTASGVFADVLEAAVRLEADR
jgi:aspartokinase/homoserine dehydrogenase 1